MRARLAILVLALHGLASAACASQPQPAVTDVTSAAPREAAASSVTGGTDGAGGALPSAQITTLHGEPADVGQIAHGRVTLVSFWATWCEACLKEMDALNRLAERTASRPDALVVGVAVGESPANVDAFVRRRGLGYVQLVDEQFRLADALGQRRVPATLVVDRAGRVVHRGEALDGASLEAFRRTLGDPR